MVNKLQSNSSIQMSAQRNAMSQRIFRRSDRFITLMAFLVGLGLMVQVRVGVRLSLTELSTPFIFVALSGGLQQLLSNRVVRNTILFLVLYLAGVVQSDFFGEVDQMEFLKGIARPIFLLGLLVNFGLILVNGTKYIVPLIGGFFCGAVLHMVFNTAADEYDFTLASMDYAFYVFRVTPFLTLGSSFIAYLLLKANFRWLASLTLISAMCVTVAISSRSSLFSWFIGLALILSAVYRPRIDVQGILFPGRKIFMTIVAFVVLSTASYYVYRELAIRDIIGYGNKGKGNLKQLENNFGWGPLGLLVSGRPDSIAPIFMIMDAPILGHGSSFYGGEYYLKALELTGATRRSDQELYQILGSRKVGGHSIIFGQWASSGILALPFWLYVLFLMTKLAAMLVLAKDKYVALVGLLIAIMSWELFFSPFSVAMRSYTPLIMVFAGFYIPELQQRFRPLLFTQPSMPFPMRQAKSAVSIG